jgi:hypothetical protein
MSLKSPLIKDLVSRLGLLGGGENFKRRGLVGGT